MARLTTLPDVCFPVAERPVYSTVDGPSGERHLPIPGKKAIVNCSTGRVLGVVSRDYRLVTNKQALAWAYECCRAVFPRHRSAEWAVSATDAPATGGHCHIDLVHRSAALDFGDVRPGQRPEAFGPFIRVTNSYNGLRALAFDIGFHRKVCRNGLIAPDTIIQFKFSHQRRDLRTSIAFEVAHDRVARLQRQFESHLAAVKACSIPRALGEPILRNVLRLGSPASIEEGSREAEGCTALDQYVVELSKRYMDELGENAYAVLNAMTDFASRPPANRYVRRDRHSLQRLAGAWLSEFSRECQHPHFDIESYVERLVNARSD